MKSLYYQTIKENLEQLASVNNSIFIGQQVLSENFYGLLTDISKDKRMEMLVAEELQCGISLGLSLEGHLPISIYQRMDFLPRAADQLVNHLDLFPSITRGKFIPKTIIVSTVGSTKPFDVGLQHNKSLIEGFRLLLPHISIYNMKTVDEINKGFNSALESKTSSILVIWQDLFEGGLIPEIKGNICKCGNELQIYFEKPDGDKTVTYKRCNKCLTIYEEIFNGRDKICY